MTLDPRNLTAQLDYRGAGNPPSTHPDQAISNCYPGLEFDLRNAWRRIFEGITLHEADNLVVDAPAPLEALKLQRLLAIGEEHALQPVVAPLYGPGLPNADPGPLSTAANPNGVVAMEWSNVLAEALHGRAGQTVACWFTKDLAPPYRPAALPTTPSGAPDLSSLQRADLVVRPFFARSEALEQPLPVVEESLIAPGELTQSLCSPWQNDYRECACYYWAASRPDYVNVEMGDDGTSEGNMWFAKDRGPREYVPDDRVDARLWSYLDLFEAWERHLKFVVGGKDHD